MWKGKGVLEEEKVVGEEKEWNTCGLQRRGRDQLHDWKVTSFSFHLSFKMLEKKMEISIFFFIEISTFFSNIISWRGENDN